MSISLSLFLYIYFVFLAGWLFFCVVSVYHLLKFGFRNFVTVFAVVFFVLVSVLFLFVSFTYISTIDWSVQVELFGNAVEGGVMDIR